MFKPGDKVVCINIENCDYDYFSDELELFRIYTVGYDFDDYTNIKLIDCNSIHRPRRFVSLKEYRKMKLEKLKYV